MTLSQSHCVKRFCNATLSGGMCIGYPFRSKLTFEVGRPIFAAYSRQSAAFASSSMKFSTDIDSRGFWSLRFSIRSVQVAVRRLRVGLGHRQLRVLVDQGLLW